MKTMKQYLSMAALALVGALMTGCSSEDDLAGNQQPENNNLVTLTTTVSLDGGATTRALTNTGVKTFAVGDKIAISYYSNTSGEFVKAVSEELKVGDITNDGKNATFTVTLDDPDKTKAVSYVYPAAMLNDDLTPNYDALFNHQDGTLTKLGSTFDYCLKQGPWNGENLPSLTLENRLAILAITLKDNAATPAEITSTITSMVVSDGTNNYTVTRSAASGPIYVAILPTSDATIDVTATDGSMYYAKSLTNKTYEAGNGYNVSWRMTEVPNVPTGALSGEFSVSATKQVYFSKGNLRYASGTWSFFDNQYDYYTSYSADAWDKFGWSTSATTYGMNTSTSSGTYSGDFVDWGATMGTGWFTLSSAEWTYLFNTRSASTVNGTENGRYAKAKVNNVPGVILFPDTYTHPDGVTAPTNVNTTTASFDSNSYTAADWTKMESAGCVFLPAAGNRSGSTVNYAGTSGRYWSATPNGEGNAYYVSFGSSNLNPANNYLRYCGYNVRLVREVPSN